MGFFAMQTRTVQGSGRNQPPPAIFPKDTSHQLRLAKWAALGALGLIVLGVIGALLLPEERSAPAIMTAEQKQACVSYLKDDAKLSAVLCNPKNWNPYGTTGAQASLP